MMQIYIFIRRSKVACLPGLHEFILDSQINIKLEARFGNLTVTFFLSNAGIWNQLEGKDANREDWCLKKISEDLKQISLDAKDKDLKVICI